MAIKKIQIIPEGTNDYGDILHPETSADVVLDTSTKVIMTKAERDKLAGIEAGVSSYTHPTTHAASMITEETNKRFMTDAERTKLSGIATGATANTGTVTSVAAGNGLNFTTITGAGSVTLGTPSTVTNATTNSVTSTSHTHALSISKTDVALGNVDNVKQMPIAGGTFTGVAVAQANTSYTTRQIRNAILSTGNPSGGSNGDLWFKYKP